jgi:CHAT domain-containing protein
MSRPPQWQREMAGRMAKACHPAGWRAVWGWLRPAPLVPLWTRVARAAAMVLLCAGVGWLAYDHWVAIHPAKLLAQAYTQQRPFDFRIPGAEQAPVRLERRELGSSFQRPQALREAEARIGGKLKGNPDSPEWLALRGRAEMLAWDPEAAIVTLTRALDAKPGDPELQADLGMAYALRAEAQGRDVDYGQAIEHLSRALKAKPNYLEAIFNRAVVYERMYLYEEALKEWRRYLELDPRGGWAEEAKRRLAEIEQKKKVRRDALDKISDDPAKLLARIAQGEQVEPEPYLDIVVAEWLPRRWEDAKYEEALNTLAGLFESRHGDRWLRDVLAARRSEGLMRGTAALAAAVKANLADETETALAKAEEAAGELRAARDGASVLRAEAEQIYALHRAFRARECVDQAVAVERAAGADKYPWIQGQVLLERGICRGALGDLGGANRERLLALQIVRASGYRILEMRVASILVSARTGAGDLLISWAESREGLARFWSGPYPGIRAHQIYFSLGSAAEYLGLRHAPYIFVKAGTIAIAETPHRLLEALGRARLARLAAAAGWTEETAKEYEHAGRLFGDLGQSTTVREHRMYAELDRTEAEIASGDQELGHRRLNGLREEAFTINSAPVQARFYQATGEVQRCAGKRREAEAAYRAAIELDERRLDSLRGFEERSAAITAAARAYRGLTEIHWNEKSDTKSALRLWEWFRSGEWPGPRREGDFEQYLPTLKRETFVVYAELRGGMVAWAFDERGVDGRRLAVEPEQIEAVAHRFVRMCADPASDQLALRRDSRQLYDWLVAPIVHRLDPLRMLVVEPDGVVGTIPMQALLDENFRYLGERFAIVVASGVADYLRRAKAGVVTVGSKVLIVASPAVSKAMIRAFPPLPQSLREGKLVATRFPRSVLLAQKEATLAAVKRHRSESELFHFAGHGFSNAGNGGLLLASAESDPLGAEVLDGKRLAGQDWTRCRLAVLSACSTGTGEAKGPVNPESLVRRLLWAGAARVVASRWNVDAETVVLLMDGFYTALLAGLEVPAALQQSARRLREHHATNHPYYWAGFQSFGSR